MKKRIEYFEWNYLPPGKRLLDSAKGLIGIFIAMIAMSVISFGNRFWDAYVQLYYRPPFHRSVYSASQLKAVLPDAEMAPFGDLVHGTMIFFWVLAAFSLFAIYENYASFRMYSKSIYVMKRLKDKNELARRCVTLPLLSVVMAGILAFVILGLFAAYYKFATPDGLAKAVTLYDFGRAFIW